MHGLDEARARPTQGSARTAWTRGKGCSEARVLIPADGSSGVHLTGPESNWVKRGINAQAHRGREELTGARAVAGAAGEAAHRGGCGHHEATEADEGWAQGSGVATQGRKRG